MEAGSKLYIDVDGAWRFSGASERAQKEGHDCSEHFKKGSLLAEIKRRAVSEIRADLIESLAIQDQELKARKMHKKTVEEQKEKEKTQKDQAKKDFEMKYKVKRTVGNVKDKLRQRFELKKAGELLATMQVEVTRMHNKMLTGFDFWQETNEASIREVEDKVRAKLARKRERRLKGEEPDYLRSKMRRGFVTSTVLARLATTNVPKANPETDIPNASGTQSPPSKSQNESLRKSVANARRRKSLSMSNLHNTDFPEPATRFVFESRSIDMLKFRKKSMSMTKVDELHETGSKLEAAKVSKRKNSASAEMAFGSSQKRMLSPVRDMSPDRESPDRIHSPSQCLGEDQLSSGGISETAEASDHSVAEYPEVQDQQTTGVPMHHTLEISQEEAADGRVEKPGLPEPVLGARDEEVTGGAHSEQLVPLKDSVSVTNEGEAPDEGWVQDETEVDAVGGEDAAASQVDESGI